MCNCVMWVVPYSRLQLFALHIPPFSVIFSMALISSAGFAEADKIFQAVKDSHQTGALGVRYGELKKVYGTVCQRKLPPTKTTLLLLFAH